jgi:hypothetical protein
MPAQKGDPVCHLMAACVFLGYVQGVLRGVNGDDLGTREVLGQGGGDRAAAGADVDQTRARPTMGHSERLFDQMLSLGTGDEDAWIDEEVEVEKRLVTDQVGHRRVCRPLCNEVPVAGLLIRGQHLFGMDKQCGHGAV